MGYRDSVLLNTYTLLLSFDVSTLDFVSGSTLSRCPMPAVEPNDHHPCFRRLPVGWEEWLFFAVPYLCGLQFSFFVRWVYRESAKNGSAAAHLRRNSFHGRRSSMAGHLDLKSSATKLQSIKRMFSSSRLTGSLTGSDLLGRRSGDLNRHSSMEGVEMDDACTSCMEGCCYPIGNMLLVTVPINSVPENRSMIFGYRNFTHR